MGTSQVVGFLRRRTWAKHGVAWPWWIPACFTCLALVTAVGAVVKRDAMFPPGLPALLALVAVSPWLLHLVTAWRRPSWLFALVVNGAVAALTVVEPLDFDFAPLLLMLLVGELAAAERIRVSVPLAVASALMLVALDVAGAQRHSLFWAVTLLAAWDIGFVMQWQMKLVGRERDAAAARAEQAAVQERQRIAREVHDVIAHSLSVTMLHLTAARHSLEDATDAFGTDVADAVEALRDAERLGRQAMSDIRRTVGLLESGGGETHALPGVPEIVDLVGDFRSAGMRVAYELHGDPGAVPGSAGLGLYRIAQESLSNVAKHAPGAEVRATLDLSANPRRFTIWNSLPDGSARTSGDGTGSGVRGMAERASLMGGACRAGSNGHGWLVEVEFPGVEAPHDAEATREPDRRCGTSFLGLGFGTAAGTAPGPAAEAGG